MREESLQKKNYEMNTDIEPEIDQKCHSNFKMKQETTRVCGNLNCVRQIKMKGNMECVRSKVVVIHR